MNPYTIERFAVIGAGNMGSGIAQKIAAEGRPVTLVDLDDEKVQRGLGIIRKTLEKGVERRVFRPEQVEEILGRIHGTSDWSELDQVDLVVEAVFEDLEVKRGVFERLGEVCKPTAILATNTSSFYVKDLAAVTPHPERVIGLHYFYHPAMNRLVEVIGHAGSDPAAVAAAWAAQEAIGKTPIRSADAPGFVVNRYFVPWINESVRLLDEGVADIATIEWAAKKAFGVGMGPFQLMNVTGVPISLHAANTLGHELHGFYAPAAGLKAKVEAGGDWDYSGAPDETRYDAVADRLLGVVFYVCCQLVEEKVGTVEDTDIGALVGLRWPRGPFHMLNKVGAERARLLAEAAVGPHGLELPMLLRNAGPEGIPIKLVSLETRDEVHHVRLNRPAAMNALNQKSGLQFVNAVELARAEGGRGIVIESTGKAFVAGADVKFFVENLKRNTFEPIHDFAAAGQEVYRKLSGGPQPVVARVHGLALGGGAEMALACDWIVASPKAAFAFPETGIGIYPGLGGTQRLARRIGLPLAKWLVYTGEMLDAATARAIGLCDVVAPFAELDEAVTAALARGPLGDRPVPATAPGPEWQALWDFFSHHTVAAILAGEADTGDDPRLERAVKKVRQKSPHALLCAERVFDRGFTLPLEEALELELNGLREVFLHPDALEGMSALLEGRRPEFAALAAS
ncbi:MAG: 3-hydroxyacyl-CoA dehydrogenase/enoyl-CoA hydratase family protein [Planctomycetota bacterium]|nr:MAG: 3-hydroxyacyl-CoA dehydrogenase/enoyl-CoA hydratase family protein [Planctomycetota bacterium]